MGSTCYMYQMPGDYCWLTYQVEMHDAPPASFFQSTRPQGEMIQNFLVYTPYQPRTNMWLQVQQITFLA